MSDKKLSCNESVEALEARCKELEARNKKLAANVDQLRAAAYHILVTRSGGPNGYYLEKAYNDTKPETE